MNYKIICRIISQILAIEAALMLPAVIIGVCDGTMQSVLAFLVTIAATLVFSGVLSIFSRRAKKGFYAREGLVCVGLGWTLMSIFGCLPFVISGEIPSFINALFETVSGFTTTGSSILENVELLSRCMLYWRSFSHWLGGMGVLVLVLAVIPKSKDSGGFSIHLLRAESPGPDVSKLMPKLKKTAIALYSIYVSLTVINFVALLIAKMPWFDALCTAFGTAGTGGFGIKADSLTGYSPAIQIVTTVFMLLFGINFNCYYWLMLRNVRSVLKNEELRLYLGSFVVATALITVNTLRMFSSVGEVIRHASFQVASIMTTTGFATTDFNLWPSFSKAVILALMIMGACVGSTGGGFKCIRVLLLFKSLKRSIKKMLHPQSVETVRVDGEPVREGIINGTVAYLIAYAFIAVASFLVISIDGFSVETNLSAMLSCLNNIGPGFDVVGPMGSFAGYGIISKLVLIFDMLAGRLEIFPVLVLFSKRTWKVT